jgi:hypothetical protein
MRLRSVRIAGASVVAPIESELAEALERGIDIETYLGARDAGADHCETLAVARAVAATTLPTAGYTLESYTRLRRFGVGHRDALRINRSSYRDDYLRCRDAGATHGEAVEVMHKKVSSWSYARRRQDGVGHRMALHPSRYLGTALSGGKL